MDTRAKCGICKETHPTSSAAIACFDSHVQRARERNATPLTAADMYPGQYKPCCAECGGMGCDACYGK